MLRLHPAKGQVRERLDQVRSDSTQTGGMSRSSSHLLNWSLAMTDPIVEEIHQAREKILEECDGDLDKLTTRDARSSAGTVEVFTSWKGISVPSTVCSAPTTRRLLVRLESTEACAGEPLQREARFQGFQPLVGSAPPHRRRRTWSTGRTGASAGPERRQGSTTSKRLSRFDKIVCMQISRRAAPRIVNKRVSQ